MATGLRLKRTLRNYQRVPYPITLFLYCGAAYHDGERASPELAWPCVFVPSMRSSPKKSTKPIKAMDRPS